MASTIDDTACSVGSKAPRIQQARGLSLAPGVIRNSFLDESELADSILESHATASTGLGILVRSVPKRSRADRTVYLARKRSRVEAISASNTPAEWKRSAEHRVGSLSVFFDTRITGYDLEIEASVNFNAPSWVLERYARLAIRKGWPECNTGDSSMHDGRVFTQGWITIPPTAMPEFGKICESLERWCKESKHGWSVKVNGVGFVLDHGKEWVEDEDGNQEGSDEEVEDDDGEDEEAET